ncbi:MAG: hypothetical protein WDM92_13095 [Caulobacteraceae bacterium]
MIAPSGEFAFTRLERVIFGPGKVAALGEALARRGLERTVVVTGATLGRSALLGKVTDAMGGAMRGGVRRRGPARPDPHRPGPDRRVAAAGRRRRGQLRRRQPDRHRQSGRRLDHQRPRHDRRSWRAGFRRGLRDGGGGPRPRPHRPAHHPLGRGIHPRRRDHRRRDPRQARGAGPPAAAAADHPRPRTHGGDAGLAVGPPPACAPWITRWRRPIRSAISRSSTPWRPRPSAC